MLRKIAPLLLFTSISYADVYRCGNSYSVEPCSGGHQVDVSPLVTDPSGPSTKEIFLCRSIDKKFFWSSGICPNGWILERTARVSSSLPWNDQVQEAINQQQKTNETIALPSNSNKKNTIQENQSNKEICNQLDERIKWLDSMARVNSTQWITDERKSIRDRQFRIRC